MSDPIATIFADAHTDRGAWAHRSIYGDSEYSLFQIFEYSNEHGLPLFSLGDGIDISRPRSEAVYPWTRLLRARPRHLPSYYIEGQHEMSVPPWLEVIGEGVHFSAKTIELANGNIRIYGLNFQPRGRLQEELDKLPSQTDIFMGHQVWSDFMGGVTHGEGEFADIPHAKMVFTGDYHKHVTVQAVGKSEQVMTVYSPGSTNLREISEEPKKYFYVLYDDLTVKSVRLRTRIVLDESVITTEDQLDHFLSTIDSRLSRAEAKAASRGLPEHIRTPLIRVKYLVTLSDAYAKVKSAIRDRAHVFWCELVPESLARYEGRQARVSSVVRGMQDVLVEVIPDTNSALYQDTYRLLTTDDDDITAAVASIAEGFLRE